MKSPGVAFGFILKPGKVSELTGRGNFLRSVSVHTLCWVPNSMTMSTTQTYTFNLHLYNSKRVNCGAAGQFSNAL